MTNSGMKGIFDKFGDQTFAIFYDNNITELYGYSDNPAEFSARVKLINSGSPLETGSANKTSEDLISTSHKMEYNGKMLNYKMIHASECVQWVGVMQDKSADYRPDPIVIKGW